VQTVTWLPHNTPMPVASSTDLLLATANNLTTTLSLHAKNNILPPHNTNHRQALNDLSNIFQNAQTDITDQPRANSIFPYTTLCLQPQHSSPNPFSHNWSNKGAISIDK
jgi:hypothetical protein